MNNYAYMTRRFEPCVSKLKCNAFYILIREGIGYTQATGCSYRRGLVNNFDHTAVMCLLMLEHKFCLLVCQLHWSRGRVTLLPVLNRPSLPMNGSAAEELP